MCEKMMKELGKTYFYNSFPWSGCKEYNISFFVENGGLAFTFYASGNAVFTLEIEKRARHELGAGTN